MFTTTERTATSGAGVTMDTPWMRDVDQLPECERLTGRHTADVVVVGGGLAGLAVAYHLRRDLPDARIALLEAVTLGSGATGHSTGIARPGVWGSVGVARARYGDASAAAMYQATLEGVRAVGEITRREGIDCELAEGDQWLLALCAKHANHWRDEAKNLRELGFDVAYLERGEVSDRIGVDRQFGSYHVPAVLTLNPWLLCRGLRTALLRLDVDIYERSPVIAIQPGPTVEVVTPHGRITADRVVMAIDGYAQPSGLLRNQIAPVRVQAIATDPLTPEQRAAVRWSGTGVILDSRSYFNYIRFSPDGRIICGGGRYAIQPARPGATSRVPAATWARLERELATVFPKLGPISGGHAWSGVTGGTLDRLPLVGPVTASPNVWYAGGWNGRGFPLSMHSGAWIARRLAIELTGQTPSPGLAPDSRPLPDLPWHRGRTSWVPLGAAARVAYEVHNRWVDGADRRACRRDLLD